MKRRAGKPVTSSVEYGDPVETMTPDAPGEIQGERITRSGGHYVQQFVDKKKNEHAEDNARALRNFGGRDLDTRRVPPPEHQLSGRTWKSSSKIRFPSKLFRENLSKIDWSK